MTNEEAIDLLDNLIGMIEDNHSFDYDTALKMGIKALEQSHDGCKDCKYEAYPEYYYPCCECKQNYMDEWKAIPSAETKTGHWEHIRCDMYECSKCQHIYTDLSGEKQGMNFCPNCGSEMEEGD